MRKIITLIISLSFFLITSCASQSSAIKKTDIYVEKSIQYFTDKKYSKARDRFQNIINKYDEIIETHRLTGSDTDYMLKIVAPSIEEYDNFQQKLIGELEFTKMSSSISLQEMKNSHILPLNQFKN